MENFNLFSYLKNKSSEIIISFGYSDELLDDDDYLHDFLIYFKSFFNNEQLEVLMAYNIIFQFRTVNNLV
jgi:hypothetical protein